MQAWDIGSDCSDCRASELFGLKRHGQWPLFFLELLKILKKQWLTLMVFQPWSPVVPWTVLVVFKRYLVSIKICRHFLSLSQTQPTLV